MLRNSARLDGNVRTPTRIFRWKRAALRRCPRLTVYMRSNPARGCWKPFLEGDGHCSAKGIVRATAVFSRNPTPRKPQVAGSRVFCRFLASPPEGSPPRLGCGETGRRNRGKLKATDRDETTVPNEPLLIGRMARVKTKLEPCRCIVLADQFF